MVEPAFLAVTSTPSIGPSSLEVTWPASAAAPSASDGAALTANTNVRQTLASSALRIRIFDPPSEICVSGGPARGGRSAGHLRESPRTPNAFDRPNRPSKWKDKPRTPVPQCRSGHAGPAARTRRADEATAE